jgi:hypothetical protein
MQVIQGPGELVALEKEQARQAWQVLGSVAAVDGEYVPGAQGSQAESPVVLAYVPAEQSSHGLPDGVMGEPVPVPCEEANVPTSHAMQADCPYRMV